MIGFLSKTLIVIKIILILSIFPAFVLGSLYFFRGLIQYSIGTTPTTEEPPTEPKICPVPNFEIPQQQGNSILSSRSDETLAFTPAARVSEYPILTLGKRNLLIFRGIVDAPSMSILTDQATQMSKKLKPNEPIYLYIESPGGEVDSGLLAIDSLKALPQEVKTITSFSASMAFHIVENLGERIVLPSGTFMSHRVAISGLRGSVPGNAVTRLNAILTTSNHMDEVVAKRIGLPIITYQSLIADEWWGQGEDNVKYRMADKVMLVRCGVDLLEGSYWQEMETPFGKVYLEWAACPLVAYPKTIRMDNPLADLIKFMHTLLYDKREFVETYVKSGVLLGE